MCVFFFPHLMLITSFWLTCPGRKKRGPLVLATPYSGIYNYRASTNSACLRSSKILSGQVSSGLMIHQSHLALGSLSLLQLEWPHLQPSLYVHQAMHRLGSSLYILPGWLAGLCAYTPVPVALSPGPAEFFFLSGSWLLQNKPRVSLCGSLFLWSVSAPDPEAFSL